MEIIRKNFLEAYQVLQNFLSDDDNIKIDLFADMNQLKIVKTIKINSKNNSNF